MSNRWIRWLAVACPLLSACLPPVLPAIAPASPSMASLRVRVGDEVAIRYTKEAKERSGWHTLDDEKARKYGKDLRESLARTLAVAGFKVVGPNEPHDVIASIGGSDITVSGTICAGQADVNGDGQVSLQELSDWVSPRVVRDAKKDSRDQHPKLVVGSAVGGAASFIVEYGLATK